MPNEFYRQRAISAVLAARREYEEVQGLDHAAMRGRIREIAVDRLIRPFIPAPYELGTGKIVDSYGEQSSETDVIIYSRDVLPPIMYSEREGLFPAESSFFSIEIKSTLTAQELSDAIAKAERLAGLDYLFGFHTADAQQIEHPIMAVIPLLFAFNNDLTPGGKDELQRYIEHDADWATNPKLRGVCVLGHGLWQFNDRERRWYSHSPTEQYDEVIEWLSGISNSLARSRITRGYPRLGNYLMMRRQIRWTEGS